MTETITFEEVGRLLALAAARDQRTTGEADVLAWHADLNAARVAFADAADALTHFYAVEMPRLESDQRRRVTSSDVIGIVRRMRAKRLENFQYQPGPGDDNTAEYLRRLRAQIEDVAEGRRPAELPPALRPQRGAIEGRVLRAVEQPDDEASQPPSGAA